MNDVKRTILAFAISFAILMGWYYLFPPAPAPEVAPEKAAVAAEASGGQAPATQAAPAAPAPAASTLSAAAATPATEETTVISNELVELGISNAGAKIESIKLKKYFDKPGSDGNPYFIMKGELGGAGITKLGDASLRANAVYGILSKSSDSVAYSYRTTEGLTVTKTYRLTPGRYDVDLNVTVANHGAEKIKDRLSLYIQGDFSKDKSTYIFKGPAYSQSGKYEEVDQGDALKGKTFVGNVNWAGAVQNYFMVAMVPKDPTGTDLVLGGDADGNGMVKVSLAGAGFDLAPGTQVTTDYRIFTGPKSKDALASLNAGLENALYFGWFTIIAKPLLILLNLLYDLVGNYGISIIILTFFVKLLFWPLSAKSYKSMARMKELQPKLDKLKERYGNDKEKLNMEMMQLWKTHKVNPFSGCLPILVQIPVFIALYNVLMHSIEIRHAPFMFWLKDLSAPDPYYITPLLMGASMFIQQKMTPATGMGEGQMKFMLYGMPIVFTWLFKDFASGLVVYWLMNNIFSIAQQSMMMRGVNKKAQEAAT